MHECQQIHVASIQSLLQVVQTANVLEHLQQRIRVATA